MADKNGAIAVRYLARAPVRVDFAGGWTDVSRFARDRGGLVVSAAIGLYAHVEVSTGGGTISLQATDLEEHLVIPSPADIRYDGTLDLHKAALNMFPITGGVEIRSSLDVPSGSGLGASGALGVALIAALARAREEEIRTEDVAELGCLLEIDELNLLGGMQDQYAAALGGVNAFRFDGGRPAIKRFDLSGEALLDLERHLVVVDTGESHFSSGIHEMVWTYYRCLEPHVTQALESIRIAADDAADAMERMDWIGLADAMNANWLAQQELHHTIAPEKLKSIEAAMRRAGALGVKATGAGAGGCLAAIVPPDRRSDVIVAALESGARGLDTKLDTKGLVTWTEADPADVVE